MLAVIPVREGALPAGAHETVAECGGRAVLIGEQVALAAAHLTSTSADARCTEVQLCEVGVFRPGAWAAALAMVLAHEAIIVLPASPDGRDLGPRIAAALERPFMAGATRVGTDIVVVPRDGGRMMHTMPVPASLVATLQVGVRGVEPPTGSTGSTGSTVVTELELAIDAAGICDARVVEVLPPDAATIDLAEAGRIVGGGAGLQSSEQFAQLAELGSLLGASVGATRVITDRGWIEHERQIGTTGVVVAPELYLAFGISGAVQHTSGLGHPEHVISVNTDAHCPMMQLADLAVVADANAVLSELVGLLRSGGERSDRSVIEPRSSGSADRVGPALTGEVTRG